MAFLDRFKGKITKIGKEGIHEVIGMESAPVAKTGSTYYSDQHTAYKSKSFSFQQTTRLTQTNKLFQNLKFRSSQETPNKE